MSYRKSNPNGQATKNNSSPVVLSTEQEAKIDLLSTKAKQDILLAELQLKADLTETQPVSLLSVPSHPVTNSGTFPTQVSSSVLPTGASTEITLALVNTKLPAGLTVKNASVAAVPTDQALVVTLSPNNPITAVISNTSLEISNDVGNPIPVNGTVISNAGTNLNTSLLALDSTVAKDASLTILNASVNTLLKSASTLAAVTAITNTVTIKADTLINQTSALKVDGSSTTQPVSLVSTTISNFPAIQPVTGAFFQTTQPVSLASTTVTNTVVTTATLSAETTKVIGTVNVASGQSITANAGTNLNTSALALDTTLTGGTQKAITRSGIKGTSVASDVTSTNIDVNTQALDVAVKGIVSVTGGITDSQIRTTPLPISGTVNTGLVQGLTDTQLRAAALPVSLSSTTVTNTVAISGTVTSNVGTTNGLALDATLTSGTQKSILRTATKGTSVGADTTSSAIDANTQALDVSVKNSVNVLGAFFQATQPVSLASTTVSNTVAISATALPLPTGAATAANQQTNAITDLQIRATPLPISGNVVTGGITDTQIRATALPISGTVIANLGTVSGLALDTSVNSLLKPASTLAAVTSIINAVTIKADTAINQTNALKIDGSATTQPISAATLPLPSGASTATLQGTGNTSLGSIDTKLPAGLTVTANRLQVELPAGGTGLTNTEIRATALPISAASLPLPTGAATETTLGALNTKIPSGLVVTAGRLQVELPVGGTGLTNTEIRATALPVSLTSTTITGTVTTTALTDTQIRATPLPVTMSNTLALTDTQIRATPLSIITPSEGVVSVGNSTVVNLGANAVFTGVAEDITLFSNVKINVYSSHVSAIDGLSYQFSHNGILWIPSDVYSIPALTLKSFSIGANMKFFRVVYTNGATTTTEIVIQVLYHKSDKQPASVRPQDGRSNDNDFEETLGFMMGYNSVTNAWNRVGIMAANTSGNETLADKLKVNASLRFLDTAQPAGSQLVGATGTQALGLTVNTVDRAGRLLGVISTGTNTIGAVNIAPAQTLATVTTVSSVTAITNALPTGANTIGAVNIATAPATVKGNQGANFLPTQDAKDAGRSARTITLDSFNVTVVGETLMTMSYSTDNGTLTTGSSYSVTAGKRFRMQSILLGLHTIAGNTTAVNVIVRIRVNNAGAGIITSPVQLIFPIRGEGPANMSSIPSIVTLPDGLEFVGGAGISITTACSGFVATTAAPKVDITIIGYEY